jgi:hypothetical protein
MKKSLLLLIAAGCLITTGFTQQQTDRKIEALIQKAVALYRFNGSILVSKNGKI